MKGWTIFILISINQMKIVPEELWCAADPVRKMDPMPVPMVISTEQPKPIRINLWGSWNEMPSDNVNWFLLAGTLSSREITRFMPNLVRSREINDVQSECLACLLTSERCMHRFNPHARTHAQTHAHLSVLVHLNVTDFSVGLKKKILHKIGVWPTVAQWIIIIIKEVFEMFFF